MWGQKMAARQKQNAAARGWFRGATAGPFTEPESAECFSFAMSSSRFDHVENRPKSLASSCRLALVAAAAVGSPCGCGCNPPGSGARASPSLASA